MSKIINARARFKTGIDFYDCGYTVDDIGNIGVRSSLKDIELFKDEYGWHLKSNGGSKSIASLAEFLWVAATLIDGEGKHKPDVEMVGYNDD
jgi:hypothetical protein